jgi:F-type H+-transporting ATPase subunit gamma
MAGIRDIKRRIKSVRSTQKITRSMHMVASAKLRRVRDKAERSRDYVKAQRQFAKKLAAAAGQHDTPYTKGGDGPSLYTVITSDRGLSGGYNSNIAKAALAHMESSKSVVLIVVGSKGASFFARYGKDISRRFGFIGDDISKKESRKIAIAILEAYGRLKCQAAYLAFTEFITTLNQQPKVVKLLPVEPVPDARIATEPSPEAVIEKFVYHYILGQVHAALLEAKASETAARMTAMESATKNAEELINDLTLSFNRARQAAITKELSEIVGGAEALVEH